jgi:hypothetical protein
MHFTETIRPVTIPNDAIIMNWIKEGRAYVKMPQWMDFQPWGCGDHPNFHELCKSGAVFKAKVKQAPKFEIGQRVNIAEEKRVAPNPDYAYGIVIGIDFDVGGTVTYKLHLRSGPYRREISVEEKYLVLAEHVAQPASEPKFKVGQRVRVYGQTQSFLVTDVTVCTNGVPTYSVRDADGSILYFTEAQLVGVDEPKFKVGQKVKIVADLTGWHGTCAMVCAVNECSGDICVLGDVAKEYRWYKPYQLELEEKPQPKFKVGDRVQLDQTAPAHSNKIGSIVEVLENEEYSVKFDNHASAITVQSGRLTLAATNPKFKAGDRVYLSYEGHFHDRQTGTVRIAYSDHDCLVQFDGHGCEHTVPETRLWLVKFANGQQVCCDKGYRLAEYKKLEVRGVLGKAGSDLIYQLKATKADGSTTTVSARETALSVAPAETSTEPKFPEGTRVRHIASGLHGWVSGHSNYVSRGSYPNRVVLDKDLCSGFANLFHDSELEEVGTEAPADMMPKVHHDEAMRWAEGLILQLPQTHDGRNSWLMNHSKASQEVITDPKAVVHLLTTNAVVRMQYEGLNTKVCETTIRDAEQLMKEGATFIWHRKEKRQG